MESAELLKPIEFNSFFEALPLLLVLLAFAGIGLWMVAFPDDARRFMDNSLKRGDAYFDRKESRPTPRVLPTVLGAAFLVFALMVAAILVISILA